MKFHTRKDCETISKYVDFEWIGENISPNGSGAKAAMEVIPEIIFN